MRHALAILCGITVAAPLYATMAMQATPAAPVAAAPAAAPATGTDDTTIRCRRIEVTGSLIRRERVCKTLAEWRRLAERGNDLARDVVGGGAVCSGGACRGTGP